MKSKLKAEVKAVVIKWKTLITYLKEEDKSRPVRAARMKQRA